MKGFIEVSSGDGFLTLSLNHIVCIAPCGDGTTITIAPGSSHNRTHILCSNSYEEVKQLIGESSR